MITDAHLHLPVGDAFPSLQAKKEKLLAELDENHAGLFFDWKAECKAGYFPYQAGKYRSYGNGYVWFVPAQW